MYRLIYIYIYITKIYSMSVHFSMLFCSDLSICCVQLCLSIYFWALHISKLISVNTWGLHYRRIYISPVFPDAQAQSSHSKHTRSAVTGSSSIVWHVASVIWTINGSSQTFSPEDDHHAEHGRRTWSSLGRITWRTAQFNARNGSTVSLMCRWRHFHCTF